MKNNLENNLIVIIPTRVEDIQLLKKAFDSVRWVKNILIADSSTTKHGASLIKKFANKRGAQYIHRKYKYSADFKNWAISQVKQEWVLLLDSDEILTKELKNKIERLFLTGDVERHDGYLIARKHFFFGNFLRFGGRYPLYNIRLFRKQCRYEDRDVHAHIIIPGSRIGKIPFSEGDILHYSDRYFGQFFEKFNRYSDYQARYIKKVTERKRQIRWFEFLRNALYAKAVIKDFWFFLPAHSALKFFWMYIVKAGFLDGLSGLKIALLYSLQDYVSKTKYYLINDNIFIAQWRMKVQNLYITFIAQLFGVQKRVVVEEFYKHLRMRVDMECCCEKFVNAKIF